MEDLAVLIPVYNDQAGLDQTLDSIDEPANAFTVVVVDDGSSPGITVDTTRYDFAVELVRLEANGGIVGALNAGLRHILGRGFEFVARLDAADLNRRGRFQLQHDHMVAEGDLYLLGSNASFRSEGGGRELFETRLPLTRGEIGKWMVFRNCFIHPTVMLRSSCLREIGLYDGRYPHIEDYVLFNRISERFRSENLEQVLVDCTVREGGISRLHGRQQLLSGLRFRWEHPQLLNPLWYAYIAKRLSYLVVPFRLRNGLKAFLGFVRRPA